MTRMPRCRQPWVNSTKSPSVPYREATPVVLAGRYRVPADNPAGATTLEIADAVAIGIPVGVTDRQ
jgi:hypothetical protein